MKKSVWIADPDNAFVKAELKSEDEVVLADGTVKKLPRDEIFQVNPAQFDRANDIAELTFLNEASVVNNLSTRYANDEIYTYSGLFLVAVNPYKQLPIYGQDSIAAFKNKTRDDSVPHIYAVAEEAYRRMLESRANQSILITGESGAGKTENTKKTIQYLSAITRTTTGKATTEERILQTNPVLEAFGNSQTVRNNNSSRFGKFIRIEFGRKDTIAGASIDWYLLEKSRVIVQSELERNYHIFYYMLKGADASLRKKLLISNQDPSTYNYLSGAPTIEHVDDAAEFERLLEALKTVGFSSGDIESVLSIVSAVLHLGQIEVAAQSTDQGRLPNMEQVRKVCKLLGVKEDVFAQILTKPKIKAGRELVQKANSASQIKHSISSLAMSLYERLFGHLVERLNGALKSSVSASNFIGVLDIAGFEIFERNSFEQLCINYTNEKLQQFFNHHMFVLEQAEYVKEEIEWEYVDYGSDLQPTIDLIEKANPMGIFACLDEDCVMPRTTDASFTDKLVGKWDQKPGFRPARLNQGFVVKHYAADVEYSTEGWLEKNKDPLNEQITELLAQGSNELAAKLFASASAPPQSATASAPAAPSKLRKGIFRTVAQRHRDQLNELMATLEATHPHFVRCIVPNTTKTPTKFQNKLVLEQLRCNGVLEGIRIARSGFPNRVEFDDFCARYQALLPSTAKGGSSAGLPETCVAVLKHLQLNPSSYKIGTTKVFFKNGVLAELEEHRDQLLLSQTTAVQALARGFLTRRVVQRQLFRQVASKQLGQTARIWLANREDPWWKLVQSVRPLLANNESKENNRKDLRIQKLQDHIQAAKHESDLRHAALQRELKDHATTNSDLSATITKHESTISELRRATEDNKRALQAAKNAHEQALAEALAEAAEQKEAQAMATDKLVHNLKSTETRAKELDAKHTALKSEHEALQAKLDTTTKALREARTLAETAQSRTAGLEAAYAKLESSQAEAFKHAKTNKQEAEEAREARQQLETEVKELRAEISGLKGQSQRALEQTDSAKTQFSQRLNEYVTKLEAAEEANKKLKKQALESDVAASQAGKRHEQLLRTLGDAGLDAERVHEQVRGLREGAESATSQAGELKAAHAKALQSAETANGELKAELVRLKAQLESQGEAQAARHTAAQQAQDALKRENEALKRQATEAKDALKAESAKSREAQKLSEAHKASSAAASVAASAELKQLRQAQEELMASNAELKAANAELVKVSASAKREIVELRSQAAAAAQASEPDLETKHRALQAAYTELNSAHAQLKARTDPAQLEAQRKQVADLKQQVERLKSQQPQDYEQQLQKSRNEKADVMAENSRLLFRRTSGGLPVVDHTAEIKRLENDVKVLKLRLVKSERERKMAQANANGLDGVELLKERDAAVRNWEKVKGLRGTSGARNGSDPTTGAAASATRAAAVTSSATSPTSAPAPANGDLFVAKRKPLRQISSNDSPSKRLTSHAKNQVIAELSDNLREEAEAVNLYRKRANDYQLKIEQAQVIMQTLQFSEERLMGEIDTLKAQNQLAAANNDKELELRNATIKRLRSELEALRDTDASADKQAMERTSQLMASLSEVTSERDVLLSDKIKLEQRLRYEWAGQDPMASRKEELQTNLKQTRRKLSSTMHELEELRSSSELNASKLGQFEERLRIAEQRNLEQEEELERLRDAGFDASLKLKEQQREMAAIREENLRLEKRRSQGTFFI